jgi:hypothetical protein
MNDKCYEIGTIQAFLDGETTPELSFRLTDHTAECDKCALALAEAEEENSQVFAMLDREMNTLVPTQRLWSSITVAIAEEKRQHSIWDRIRTGILTTFANPSISVAAGVLLVFGLFAAVWTVRTPVTEQARLGGAVTAVNPQAESIARVNTTGNDSEPFSASNGKDFGIQETRFSPGKIRDLVQPAVARSGRDSVRPERAVVRSEVETYLPGEETYVRTIAGLKETVDSRKDTIMSPSVRISYERDMAVVNDSIQKMKDVVSRNPKNQAAKQVLYSSYQNKIDLLNSVVDREELMASMQ